jgi:hypothetical protein
MSIKFSKSGRGTRLYTGRLLSSLYDPEKFHANLVVQLRTSADD